MRVFNPGTQEAEAGPLRVQGQSGLQELVPGQVPKQHRNTETLSQKKTNKKHKNKPNNQKVHASMPASLVGSGS